MDYISFTEKLKYLTWLIEKRNTGTANDLSVKLEISIRSVERMIETLRLQGMEIKFCRVQRRYILTDL
ncbi:MAG: HTH domain-containing protein [Cytophagales bacterium]|nr:HTH domain-containing protein [Cytophagales bacterium]